MACGLMFQRLAKNDGNHNHKQACSLVGKVGSNKSKLDDTNISSRK